MCLIVFAHAVHPHYPLLLAANRDEFYARPTEDADFWADHPSVLAGRDCEAGGTWLGVSRQGRIAAITNFSDPVAGQAAISRRSRGELTTNFLLGTLRPGLYLANVQRAAKQYAGFNLLVGTMDELWYYSNRGPAPRALEAGVYGLSNHLLDTPWPKLVQAREKLQQSLKHRIHPPSLLATVSHRQPLIPASEVGEQQALLSSPFIVSDQYGTRASTALQVDNNQGVQFTEQNYTAQGREATRKEFSFNITSCST